MPVFILFSKLPFEIREYIWQLSAEPRVIEAEAARVTEQTFIDRPSDALLFRAEHGYVIFRCLSPAPMRTCSEARKSVLLHYSPLFSTTPRSEHPDHPVPPQIPTWICPAVDTVHCNQFCLPFIDRTWLAPQIELLKVGLTSDFCWVYGYETENDHRSYIMDMPKLKCLTLYGDDWYSSSNAVIIENPERDWERWYHWFDWSGHDRNKDRFQDGRSYAAVVKGYFGARYS